MNICVIVDQVYVDAAVAQYAVDLVMATREPARRSLPELEPLIEFGVSPRATLGLVAAGKALALLRGRSYVIPQDVFDVGRDVLRHRIMISYEALAKGLTADDTLNRILAVVPAAEVSPREATDYAQSAVMTTPAPSPTPESAPMPTPALYAPAPQPGSLLPPPPPQHNGE